MKRFSFLLILIIPLFQWQCTRETPVTALDPVQPAWKSWTETPPFGWNSYDAYDDRITEEQFKSCVDILAEKMLPHGYEYAVIDFRWFVDDLSLPKEKQKELIDKYGRAIPSPDRYPSSANGAGFKKIADYVHSKGMKFGIHIMRGVPREALLQNCPVSGTDFRISDMAEAWDSCEYWNDNMWGVNHNPAGQAYYNSLFNLYAEWGVDYVKADDMMVPRYHKYEIEMMRKAIDQCGRPIVLSLSCGESQVSFAPHLTENANMFRISIDIWDKWSDVKRLIELAHYWTPFIGEGTWPDADMVPIGVLKIIDDNKLTKGRLSKLTRDEQYTMLNIWAMMRSPIMWGGDPLSSSEEAFNMMTNDEWLDVIRYSRNNRQIYQRYGRGFPVRIWFADIEDSKDKYFAIFNNSDEVKEISFDFEMEYLRDESYIIRDLWQRKDLGYYSQYFNVKLEPHASGLYRLKKVNP